METYWLSSYLGRDGEELDDEDIVGESVVRKVAQELFEFAPRNSFINCFIVCMMLRLFGHVKGFSRVPRCFLQKNIH